MFQVSQNSPMEVQMGKVFLKKWAAICLGVVLFFIGSKTASAQGLEELLELTIGVAARDAIDAGEFDSFVRNDCTACQQQTEIIDRISIGLKLFLGLEGSDFELLSQQTDPMGYDHLRFTQIIGGYPVWGKEVIVHVKNDRLYVLTPSEVIRYDTMSNPREPVEKDSVRVRGSTYRGMRLDGNWIYLDGNRTESIYDDMESGMTLMGEHDVGDWVQGRIVRDGQAERVRYGSRSSFEVWGED
jgi:hypothetical protein